MIVAGQTYTVGGIGGFIFFSLVRGPRRTLELAQDLAEFGPTTCERVHRNARRMQLDGFLVEERAPGGGSWWRIPDYLEVWFADGNVYAVRLPEEHLVPEAEAEPVPGSVANLLRDDSYLVWVPAAGKDAVGGQRTQTPYRE